MVSVLAPPVGASELVALLLATEDGEQRHALITQTPLDQETVQQAVTELLDEAARQLGADPRRTHQLSLDALAIAERAGDDFQQAMARMRFGDALRALGRNAEACAVWDEAAAVFTRLGRPVEAARTRIGWIMASANLGRLDASIAAARRARRVFLTHGETYRAAVLGHNVSFSLLEHGQYAAALRFCSGALTDFLRLGAEGDRGAAIARANRGIALTRLGRHREGLAELDLARREYQELGQRAGFGRVTRNIALASMDLGRYDAAIRRFEEALSIFRELHLSAEAVWTARDLAGCLLALNRPASALAILWQAEEDLRSTDSVHDALSIANRKAATFLALGDESAALATLAEAERLFPTGAIHERAWLATYRAAALLHSESPSEALAAAAHAGRLARSSGTRRLLAEALLVESAARLGLGQTAAAERVAARAQRLAGRMDAAPLLHQARQVLGEIAEAQGRADLARRRYTAAIKQLEREQSGVIFQFRDSFAQSRGLAYERLARLQLEAGQARQAFATAERAKSRALVDAIAGRVELRPRGSIAARRLALELSRAREDYAAAFAQAAEAGAGEPARERLAALEGRIEQLLQRLQLEAAPDRVDELQGATPDFSPPQLPGGAALLEFFACGDDLLRFWVDSGGVQGEILAGALPEIERLLRIFRTNLDAAERTAPNQREALTAQARLVLGRLYQRLLSGLALDGCRSLVVVPHGPLHYLPFHALYDGERYLIERFAVSYAPSAALYRVCSARVQRQQHGRALVLAHSHGGHLPFALEEGEAVAKALRAPLHREEMATRALLESAGRRAGTIHIAAEGRFRADAPLFSHIELADGPLTTADVFNLELQAGLVTLSACETGRSLVGGGDALVGIARAFLYAGAASLLVSQWRAGDATASQLMARFYHALKQGAGAAEALRQAQIAFLSAGMPQNGQAHPFLWAGFQITGDGKRLELHRRARQERQR